MVIGTLVVFVGVMVCFEIARRATLSARCSASKVARTSRRILTTEPMRGMRILFSLVFNARRGHDSHAARVDHRADPFGLRERTVSTHSLATLGPTG